MKYTPNQDVLNYVDGKVAEPFEAPTFMTIGSFYAQHHPELDIEEFDVCRCKCGCGVQFVRYGGIILGDLK